MAGRRTSVRIEPELLECLGRICELADVSTDSLITHIATQYPDENLTSLLRAFIGSILLGKLRDPVPLQPFSLSPLRKARRIRGIIKITDNEAA